MILYKTIVRRFGTSLEREQPVELVGPDGGIVSAEDVRQHWRNTLKNFSEAKIYLLDHNAANYLDTLRMDVQGMPWEKPPEGGIERYVQEVDFPRALVWVEYDDRRLWEDRIERGLSRGSEEELRDGNPTHSGSQDIHLTPITVFSQ